MGPRTRSDGGVRGPGSLLSDHSMGWPKWRLIEKHLIN